MTDQLGEHAVTITSGEGFPEDVGKVGSPSEQQTEPAGVSGICSNP